jgi:cell volume regulation protein A
VSEIGDFGLIVLVVAGTVTLALGAIKLTERYPVPAPAVFLLVAALASDVFPGLMQVLSIESVERIGVVALVMILFDGGMHVGLSRFRRSAVPITALGVLGTIATAALMAVAAYALFDFGWTTAWILGAAIAPTDPAVMFSVLGNREVGGRAGTILEGESGANDPVGIALMIGILDFATHDDATFWTIVREFTVEMAVGLAIGVLGGRVLLFAMRRVSLPGQGLYPLRTLALAGLIYGVASVAHGSGFLAVFIAGLLIGDERLPYKGDIERFHTSIANLAEIAVFVALGLTVDLTDLGADNLWLDALLLAALLAFVARPVAAGLLLLPARLRWGERVFIMWGGLKGAVPILLAAFAVLEGVDGAAKIYGIVFIVVAFSVVVQGTSIPFAASRLGVSMRRIDPLGLRRFVVVEGSRADGESLRVLPLGERTWVNRVRRDRRELVLTGDTRLAPGDEVHAVTDVSDSEGLRRLFEVPK